MIKAAGILLTTKAGTALFLKRSGGGDHEGEWNFPGGKTEGEETALEAALRETREETGYVVKGEPQLLTRTVAPSVLDGPEVDYTTFMARVPAEFVPELDGEHTGYAWAPVNSPPEPLHPGCRIALDRLGMDELGVARAMAAGQLTSPQRYLNMTLFALRITGTGVSYRAKLNEYVYRRPEVYLTEEFLARCNGLTVVWIHPAKAVLNSKEFNKRVVGTMLLPYIQGDEVWGIAKLYDDESINHLVQRAAQGDPMSTSPGVVLWGDDTKLIQEDGSVLLIEGAPRLLDHLAICDRGVWDKGGESTGITIRGDSDMTDAERKAALLASTALGGTPAEIQARVDAAEAEEKKADAAKADAAKADARVDAALDKVLVHLDGLGKRMDAYEEEIKEDKRKKDEEEMSEEEKAKKAKDDKAKKDEEDKEAEEKKREDAAKADAAEKQTMRDKIADMEKRMPKQLTDADYNAMTDAQARADEVFGAHGKRAPRPLDGEDLGAYRRRLAGALQPHSKDWKEVKLDAIADETAFKIAEDRIYADAQTAANNPVDLPEGQLVMRTRRDPATGLVVNTFHGPQTFIHAMRPPARAVVGINTDRRR